MQDIFEVKAQVTTQEKVGPDCHLLQLAAPQIAASARPGQFVNVACSRQYQYDPLLRRPLSIYRVSPDTGIIELIYKVRGRGTELLAQKRAGEIVAVLGPLGKGFDIHEGTSRAILVAGGLGVASLMFLAQELAKVALGKGEEPYVHALIGGHSAEEIICVDDYSALGSPVKVHTWITRARLEQELEKVLEELSEQGVKTNTCSLYTCGPEGMLRRLAAWAQEHQMLCQVSLESHMSCGVGACQSCICKTSAGTGNTLEDTWKYSLVCRDGPVFNAEEVIWDE
ncbi:MAG: dihydroorotate dehydrogenase electron transfer subunit [Bacillota bacterium]